MQLLMNVIELKANCCPPVRDYDSESKLLLGDDKTLNLLLLMCVCVCENQPKVTAVVLMTKCPVDFNRMIGHVSL